MHRTGHASPAATLRYQPAIADRDRVIADSLADLVQQADVRSIDRESDGPVDLGQRCGNDGKLAADLGGNPWSIRLGQGRSTMIPSNHVDRNGVIWNQNASGAWSYLDTAGQWIPSPPPPAGFLVGPAPPQSVSGAPVPAGPPGAPAKQRKAWPWVVGGVVALLAVIVAVAAASSKKNTPPAADSATTTTSTTAAPGNPGLNQVAKDGDFAFTVKGMQCGVTTIGNPPITESAPAGTQWCLVTMTVSNDKATGQEFFAANQYAVDSSGKQLSPDDSAVAYLPGDSNAFATINPGVTVTAVVPFQLSATDHIKQVILHDSPFSGGVTVDVG